MFTMTESTLKFGPEWLRALSQGTSMSSPPPSPGLPKFKLAEHRYGREEMLAYFPKDIKMPPDLKQFVSLYKEQYQPPVTLLAMTEDEQRIWARSVNSDAVLRLMGKSPSGASGVAAPRGGRGGSIDRGRGRGRATYHQRGHSLDDSGEIPMPGAFTRQLSYERGNSIVDRAAPWDDRERRYDKGHSGGRDDDSWRKDWRSGSQRDRERDPDDDGGWRVSGSRSEKWGRQTWKSERGEWDHGDKNSDWSSSSKIPHRKGLHFNRWEDDIFTGDDLPEWSTADNKDSESVGTFDATGAFMEAKVDGCKPPEGNEDLPKNDIPMDPNSSPKSESSSSCSSPSPVCATELEQQQSNEERRKDSLPPDSLSNMPLVKPPEPKLTEVTGGTASSPVLQETIKEVETSAMPLSSTKSLTDSTSATKKEEVNFDHLEKAAENLVDTWTAEEDEKVEANHITNPINSQWFYRDPQGFVQGPFSSSEMTEWFRTGYFNMSLMIRKGSEGPFCRLGDMVKQLGYVPFLANSSCIAPSTSHPPQPVVPVTSVLNGILGPPTLPLVTPQTEIHNERDQRLRILQQQLLQQQLFQQHFLQQQQQQQLYIRQQLQQVLGGIKPDTVVQQEQLQQQQPHHYVLQRAPQQHQQRHPPGVLSRPTVENNNPSDPLQQFLARLGATHSPNIKEEPQSLWSMPGGAGQQDVMPNWPLPNQSGSVWDIETVNSSSNRDVMLGIGHILPNPLVKQDALLEEQHHKNRLNEEELLLKLREEEEQRRRLIKEEEEREREQKMREELQRKEEEEMRKREELLVKQREMEERRQKEAQEQKRKEEELRRKQEEERRAQEEREREERRKQEELKRQEEERLRKQQEAIRLQEEQRKLEEARRQEEERRRLEEEAAAVAAAAAAEKEKELQRHLELQKLHQEALKRLQEKQKPKSQAPAWGGQASKLVENASLAEIQRMQEEREKREKLEWQQQQQALLKQVQQQQSAQPAKSANLTWANKSSSGSNGPVKTLREIQQEEAEKFVIHQKELHAKKQHQQQQQQQVNNVSLSSSSVWNNTIGHLRLNASSTPHSWNNESSVHNSHGSGFWEDPSVAPSSNKTAKPQSNKQQEQKHSTSAGAATSNGQVNKPRASRAKKEEQTVKKLFEMRTVNVDEFTKWCTETLRSMESTIDIPTFVTFLKDVESPFEVHDYVRVYVGDSKEANNFVKQFLEKRSKYNNQALKKEENMWGPAPAITPSLSKPQVGNEVDGQKAPSNKKKKKGKMQKVDSAILGFTVHAAMDRINIGDIHRVEDL